MKPLHNRSLYREYWATHFTNRHEEFPAGIPLDDREFITDHDIQQGRPATFPHQKRVKDSSLKPVKTPKQKLENQFTFEKLSLNRAEQINKDNLTWHIKINDPDYVKESDALLHKMRATQAKNAEKALKKEIRLRARAIKDAQIKLKL